MVHTVRKVVWVLSLRAKSHSLENTSSTDSLDKSLPPIHKIIQSYHRDQKSMSVSLSVKELIVAPGWRMISNCTDGTLSGIADGTRE